jgi:hypothetical protein
MDKKEMENGSWERGQDGWMRHKMEIIIIIDKIDNFLFNKFN